MLTLNDEYFIRLLLLVLKGGTYVLRQVLSKKLADNCLQLSAFLHVNKEKLDKLKKDKVLTLIQYNILFPSNGEVTDSENYDISLLSCLLLNIFSGTLKRTEKKAIENIRTLRNDIPAHHPNASIDAQTFFKKWNHLLSSINNLGKELPSEEFLTLEEIVRSVGEDPIDIKQAIKDIKDATENNDHVSQQLQEIIRRQEDMRREINELQQQNRIIIGEVTLTSKNTEAALEAARILTEAAKEWKSSRDTEAPVNAFFQGITDAGGDIVAIEQGSVLLHIHCHSLLVVSHVVNYFKSSEIEERLNEIAKYLTELVGSDVNLSANIQEESLQKAHHYLEHEGNQEHTSKVRLFIKCQNDEEVLNVVKLMEGREITTKMSAISNDLSNKVGCSVTLRSSVDKTPLQQYINEDKDETEKDNRSDVSTAQIVGVQPTGESSPSYENISGPLMMLRFSQLEVAKLLEICYLQLKDYPVQAHKIRETANEKRMKNEMTSGLMKQFMVAAEFVADDLMPMMKEVIKKRKSKIIKDILKTVMEKAENMRTEAEQVKYRYEQLRAKVQGNICEVNERNKEVKNEQKELSKKKMEIEAIAMEAEQKKGEMEIERRQKLDIIAKVRKHRDELLASAVPSDADDQTWRELMKMLIPIIATKFDIVHAGLEFAKVPFHLIRQGMKTFSSIRIGIKAQEAIDKAEERQNKLWEQNRERTETTQKRLAQFKRIDLRKASLGDFNSLMEALGQSSKVDEMFGVIILYWENMTVFLKSVHNKSGAGGSLLEAMETKTYAKMFDETITTAEKDLRKFGSICMAYVMQTEQEVPMVYGFLSTPEEWMDIPQRVARIQRLAQEIESNALELKLQRMSIAEI